MLVFLHNCTFRADKLVTEEKYMKIEKEVTEKNAEEDRLKEQCKELQLKLMENSSEKERTEYIKQKLNAVEHECQKREMEACQLQVELEAAAVANTSLQNQVSVNIHYQCYICNYNNCFCYTITRFIYWSMISIKVKKHLRILE